MTGYLVKRSQRRRRSVRDAILLDPPLVKTKCGQTSFKFSAASASLEQTTTWAKNTCTALERQTQPAAVGLDAILMNETGQKEIRIRLAVTLYHNDAIFVYDGAILKFESSLAPWYKMLNGQSKSRRSILDPDMFSEIFREYFKIPALIRISGYYLLGAGVISGQ